MVVSNVFSGGAAAGSDAEHQQKSTAEPPSKDEQADQAEVGDEIVALGFWDDDLHIRVWKAVTREDVASRSILRYIQNLPRPLTIAFKKEQGIEGGEGEEQETPPPSASASLPASPRGAHGWAGPATASAERHSRRKSTGSWLSRMFKKADPKLSK